MPTGRPSKYTPELLTQAQSYLVDYADHGDIVPSIAGLAIYLGVGRRTLHDWAKDEDKEEFSHILETLMAKQEQKLLSGSLTGDYNATITKLMLTKHDYSDKTESTIQGGDKPIKTESSITFIGVGSDYSSDQDS